MVTVCPASTAAEDILAGGFDGLMLSNGPGDPAENTYQIAQLQLLLAVCPCSASAWATSLPPWRRGEAPTSCLSATGG